MIPSEATTNIIRVYCAKGDIHACLEGILLQLGFLPLQQIPRCPTDLEMCEAISF